MDPRPHTLPAAVRALLVVILLGVAACAPTATRVRSDVEATLAMVTRAPVRVPADVGTLEAGTAPSVDSVAVDSVAVDSVAVDSVAVDSVVDTTTSEPAATTVPTRRIYDVDCVIEAERDAPLVDLAAAAGLEVDPVVLWAENDGIDAVRAGDLVDVCVGNGVDDIDGRPRPRPTAQDARRASVARQQEHLNGLFADVSDEPLAVDGDSGPRTRQRLCAARLAFGLPTSTNDLLPGTEEAAVIMSATELPTPASTVLGAPRWTLIDRTCQIMFVGAHDATTFVFTTSTGSAGYATRTQERALVFRYNPARDNGGWHNSSDYPVGIDNPLNGNLYKPLYFDAGQAIHGANSVPPYPASKGCARLRVVDQERLVAWLGLDGVTTELWETGRIDLRVNVQGTWAG